MNKPEWPQELNADTWALCESLWLYGGYFADEDVCPTPPPDRKFRLMIVAALRAVWPCLIDPRSRTAVEVAEKYADDRDCLGRDEANAGAEAASKTVWDGLEEDDELFGCAYVVAFVAWGVLEGDLNDSPKLPRWVEVLDYLETDDIPGRTRAEGEAFHLSLFHDLFPNPFHPVPFDPSWQTSTVVALADAIYADRAWDRMPILADALEEAGCDDAHILDHCRTYPVHARGCWVVDLVLGKS